ncbi:MAG: hypothetical protein ABJA67_12505 [Chthonomonadales bacterium]
MNSALWTRQFWKTTREVSITGIIQEAEMGISIVLSGSPEFEESARNSLGITPAITARESSPTKPVRVIAITESASQDRPTGSFTYCAEHIGGIERTIERVLEDNPEYRISLARQYPGLRAQVSAEIIQTCATGNAEFAMLNALPGVVPIMAPLLPAGAISDMIMLTKNQAMMLYRLAAVYGKPLDMGSRSKDLAPLLGNAFSWRAIARELIGMVPGGVGLVARGAIAYAGTMALGKALAKFHATGKQANGQDIRKYYRESLDTGKALAADLAKKLLRKKRKVEPKSIA